MQILRLVVVCLFVLFMLPLRAETWLVVRGNENYPPSEMMVNKTLTGLHIDLIQAVAQRLGVKIHFESVPWARAVKMVQTGQADAITFISKNTEREQFLFYEEGNILSTVEHVLFTRKDHPPIAFTGELQSLIPYTIAVLRGYQYGELDKRQEIKRQPLDKLSQLIDFVYEKRADLGALPRKELEYGADPEKLKEIVILQPALAKREVYIAFSKAKPLTEDAKRFAREMKAFKATPEYQAILKKYHLQSG